MNEVKQRFIKLGMALGKYKYAVLVLLIGAVLIKVPLEKKQVVVETSPIENQQTLEERMEDMLSYIHGAGEVKVLLSMESGMLHAYQVDEQIKRQADGEEVQTQTVLLKDSGGQTPLETVCTYPTYRGAVILCQGADRSSVKLAIVQAVASLTGLGSDHISVIKMKSE